jgi:exopolyphosphatase/guanosine-5'-triphosphate,3'-diphosphate pyrophosphatase
MPQDPTSASEASAQSGPQAPASAADAPSPARTVGAIDIGSSSVRMVIAQVGPEGDVEVLEELKRGVRLGHDAFRRGRLGAGSMRAAVSILRDYRRLLKLYDVQDLRAVATSAVRESANRDIFLDRVLMATGLEVEVIDTTEESHLILTAVRDEFGEALGLRTGQALIAEVGGGSTLLTVTRAGELEASQSLFLGAVRMEESLVEFHEQPDRSAELIRRQISSVIQAAQTTVPLRKVRTVIAVGGEARFAARQVGRGGRDGRFSEIPRKDLDSLIDRCRSLRPEDLSREYGFEYADAEALIPALLVYQGLLEASSAKKMIVSDVSMRDGLLLELARKVTGGEDRTLFESVLRSARNIAEKYHVDLAHCESVARLAVRLFDELRGEHGLADRQRLLLEVAALVHEVGGYVSSRSHHKHSYYLIAHSEIFGLTREETEIVALVARYHRRSAPKSTHAEYAVRPRAERIVVAKLAALLRVCDALDRGHAGRVRQFTCRREGEEFVISVEGVGDLTLERQALTAKGSLFEDTYGMRIRLEEAPMDGGRATEPMPA